MGPKSMLFLCSRRLLFGQALGQGTEADETDSSSITWPLPMADSFVHLMLLSSAAPSIAAPFPRFRPLQRRVQE